MNGTATEHIDTVVIGAGQAGLATGYGPIRGELPVDINGTPARILFPLLFLLAKHVLTLRTPIGRKMRPEFRSRGGPLLRYKRADLTEVGVELTSEKTVGVTDGLPTLDGGERSTSRTSSGVPDVTVRPPLRAQPEITSRHE